MHRSAVGPDTRQRLRAAVLEVLGNVETTIPPLHLGYLRRGGFEVGGDDYTEMERYILRHYGCFLEGIANGELPPMDADQERFVLMLHGEAEPAFPSAVAWRKFTANRRR